MITDINSEDPLVQRTFAEHLEMVLGWESVCAYNTETFAPPSTLGCSSVREVVLNQTIGAKCDARTLLSSFPCDGW